jgi:hypothetical protein
LDQRRRDNFIHLPSCSFTASALARTVDWQQLSPGGAKVVAFGGWEGGKTEGPGAGAGERLNNYRCGPSLGASAESRVTRAPWSCNGARHCQCWTEAVLVVGRVREERVVVVHRTRELGKADVTVLCDVPEVTV